MRYKEYNVNRVLNKCVGLFWQYGFRGCSINQIVEETGVNRFSLYQEFDNKEGLLYASLKYYREKNGAEKLKILDQVGNAEETLKEFYWHSLKDGVEHPGCYFIHIATELADSDPQIKELVKDFLDEIETSIASLLQRNDYNAKDAHYIARHLAGLYCTAMSFSLIHSSEQRSHHIENGIHVIFNKNRVDHATSIG